MARGERVDGLDDLEKVLRTKLRESEESLRAIADATGLAASRLGDFKNGKFNFPMRKLNTLANHFKVKYRIENW